MYVAFVLMVLPLSAAALTVSTNATTAEDILRIDELGYECISAEFFEETDLDIAPIAFQIGGKIRLARTCLPDPCIGALTQFELAGLTGTDRNHPRFQEEWHDYYARYADHCRRETNPLPQDVVASAPNEAEEFWAPVLNPPIQDAIGTNQSNGVLPVSFVLPSSIEFPVINGNSDGTDNASDEETGSDTETDSESNDETETETAVLDDFITRDDETTSDVSGDGGSNGSSDDDILQAGDTLGDDTVPVAAVSLPSSGALMLTLAALFAALRRRRFPISS